MRGFRFAASVSHPNPETDAPIRDREAERCTAVTERQRPQRLARPCQSERTPPTCGGAAEPLAAGMGADLGASDAACEARAGGS